MGPFMCSCDWVAPRAGDGLVLKHCRGGASAFVGVLSGARQAPRPCGNIGPGGQGVTLGRSARARQRVCLSLLEVG